MDFLAPKLTRRRFLQSGLAVAAAPLSVGLDASGNLAVASSLTGEGLVSDFVHVTSDDRVIVVVKHVEAGQGPATGLATLVAEEMDADWDKIDVVFAPADNARYSNLAFGLQGTGGSTAMANSFMQYRQAGALALARLKEAAAAKWGTKPNSIRVAKGVLNFDGKTATFGELASAAGEIEPAALKPALKSPAEFSYIGRDGKDRLARKDLQGKTTGDAVYAMDYRPDDLLYAVVLHSPKFGGTLISFDDSEARGVGGYVGARAIGSGVAVYGNTIWSAIKARRAITAVWDESKAETRSTPQMLADYWKTIGEPGLVATQNGAANLSEQSWKLEDTPDLVALVPGDATTELGKIAKSVSADFEFPFLAHAPMEPLNCVMQFRDGKVTVWDGCQFPGTTQGAVAGVFGIPPGNVEIVSLFAGGTFGRRATPTNDYQVEAAQALRESPEPELPLKTLWTREDDIQGGYYRPMYVHRAKAGIDSDGNILAWRHDLAGKSILIGTPFEAYVQNGIDSSSVEGLANLAYSLPNLHVEVRNMQESPIPVLWWRSVGHTHTAFASEVIVDMLAETAGADPVEFRLRHLIGKPRHTGVLQAVAKIAAWDSGVSNGRFRGVAVHASFSSYVAQVVEISLDGNGAVKVEKIYCAVDCGIAVNPDIVRAQMESGIGFGLGAAMRNKITLGEGGVVEQTNFPNYEPLRMSDMPEVETVIVPSLEAPTGVGEPGVPPVAPALAAAIYAATGKRVTKLPFVDSGIKFA